MISKTAIEGLDHGIIGVANLEEARVTFQKMGFTITDRGRHEGWGTANYCIMFGPDYLEILGIIDSEQFDAGLTDFLNTNGEGLLKIVARSSDIENTRRHLEESGFQPTDIQKLGRWLEMPDGDVMPHFKLVHLPDEVTPGFRGFICQHLTPDLVWRSEWQEHANTAKAVHAYTILSDDPKAQADIYQRLFDLPVYLSEGRLIVETGGGKIIFATMEEISHMHPGLVWDKPKSNGTMMVGTIAVGSTDAVASCLKDSGTSYYRSSDGSILVQPAHAHGMAISFQAL